MKHFLHFIGLVIFLGIAGCSKEAFHSAYNEQLYTPKDSVIQFLQNEITSDVSKLDLASITKITYQNKVLAFQIFEKSSQQKFLLLRKDADNYVGNWVDLSGLSKSPNEEYSGKISLLSFRNQLVSNLLIRKNKIIRVEKTGNISASPGDVRKEAVYVLLPEVVVYTSSKDIYLSLYWLFESGSSYKSYYMVDENNGGGGGGGGSSPSASDNQSKEAIVFPVFAGPKTPIKNLKEELKCFTLNPSSKYSISVRVNQPRPKSGDKIDISADFIVGHSYLSLEQINADGSKIVRNVGLYPKTNVYPGNSEDVAIFGEDSNTPFSASLTIEVSGSELNTVINSLLNQQAQVYDLDNFNCVNSSAAALQSIGVHLPLTISGIKNIFRGYSPGELGNDIKNLNLPKFKSENGNRPMLIQKRDNNDLKPAPRKGSC